MMTYYRFSCLALLLCFAVGCGGSGDRVTGKVTFPDGSPLTVGRVMFTDGTITAFGDINARGDFRMGTNKAGNGVPSGTYQVYITGAFVPADFEIPNEDGGMSTPLILAIASEFTSPTQSGLTCEVRGSTVFNFTVERAAPVTRSALNAPGGGEIRD